MSIDPVQPLVSIITPYHDAAAYLPATIASVLAQTHRNWEWLLIDDGSTDGSPDLVARLASEDARIHPLRLPSCSGPARARNAGLDEARGALTAFIDSDDWWLPTFLERSVDFLEAGRHSLVYSSYRIYDERTGRYRRDFIVPRQVGYEDVLRSCPLSMLATLYRASDLGGVRLPELGREDFGFWLDMLKLVPFAFGMPDVLAVYRLRSRSRSNNKLRVARLQWQVYRRHERLGLLKSIRCLFAWTFLGLRKYLPWGLNPR